VGRPDQALLSALLRLTIENVGLIARAEVEFGDGFTVFTGETGSGKTMLLGALEAALGGRVEREMVRGERARVTLELGAGAPLRALLEAGGIMLEPDDDAVIVREIGANGRSQARINGVAVSAGQLRAVGALVADAIGQGEAQRLFDPAFARDVVDRFAGDEALALVARVRASFERRRGARAERDALHDGAGRALAEREFAAFALDDIDAAHLQPEEDERLRERRALLGNAEKIADALVRARTALEDERGALDGLGEAAHVLSNLARFGEQLASLAGAAAALQSDANELAVEVGRAAEAVELDPRELEEVVARLDAIEALKKKYGGSLEAIAQARERFAATLAADAGRDARLGALEAELADLERALAADVATLRALRVAAARHCEGLVAAELGALAMPAARFTIAVEPLDELAVHGADRIEFRFSANPGEPERPLGRIASGGERSRVLLALVLVLAERDEPRAFVFDEIDAGIGGSTALAVGARLRRLAEVAQVVCVTHLAQIASSADLHYALRKDEGPGATTIEVLALDEAARQSEIARMLAGEETAISLEHAATLISRAGGEP
jgi:DNA repair protein RecN (Recombination protein N)